MSLHFCFSDKSGSERLPEGRSWYSNKSCSQINKIVTAAFFIIINLFIDLFLILLPNFWFLFSILPFNVILLLQDNREQYGFLKTLFTFI